MNDPRIREASWASWPRANFYDGTIDLHVLPEVAAINGRRIRELTGDNSIPDTAQIELRAFKAVVGDREFYVGHCIGDGRAFSPVGIAVIERLVLEVPNPSIHIVPIVHADIAWDIVLRHLRTFTGRVLLFAFSDSDVYDAGTAEISYSQHIRQFGPDGSQYRRRSDADRQRVLEKKAAMLGRPAQPKLYPASHVPQEDAPWIFRVVTPVGKLIRTAVWDGRCEYAHEFPEDIIRWVGGNKIAIVQVHSPVGIDRRSSLSLTHWLSKDFDSVIHWARDTKTFHSILRSFIRLDLDSVDPPDLPEDWDPEITILGANGVPREGK